MRFHIYFLFIQFVIFCNLYSVTNGMIGQNIRIARPMEFPFVASIARFVYEDNQLMLKHYCTGSLITLKDILTAENCFLKEEKHFIRVMVGSNDLMRGDKFNVLWWVGYTQWAHFNNIVPSFKNNDIGIMRISREITYVTPGSTLGTLSYGFFGLTVTAAGWGTTETGIIPTLMRVANLFVLTNAECETRVERIQGQKYSVPPRYLCTAARPVALLHTEDVGGPLIYDGKIIGVSISTVPLPGQTIHEDSMNFHLALEHYDNYIEDVTKAN